MKIELDEEFAIKAIKNYYKSLNHKGRLDLFEQNLGISKQHLTINDNLYISAVQIEDGGVDCEGDK